MAEAVCKKEAVRLAKERLGDVPAEELAVFVAEHFGIRLKPVIVKVLLGSLMEREVLAQSGRKAMADIEKARVEAAEEKKPKGRTRKKAAPQPSGKAAGESAGK